jgi:predicted aconitase with swiveling domain
MWGGLDPLTGEIIDRHHAQNGQIVSGRILVLPAGRGSSSSSTVLAEALRAGTAPAAIVLREADEIIVLGALVAEMLDGRSLPVLQVDDELYATFRTGDRVAIASDGTIRGA